MPSLRRVPSAPVFDVRSEPARSTCLVWRQARLSGGVCGLDNVRGSEPGGIYEVDTRPRLAPLAGALDRDLLLDADRQDGVRARRMLVHRSLSRRAPRRTLGDEPHQLRARADRQLEQTLDVDAQLRVLLDLERRRGGGRRECPRSKAGRLLARLRRREEVDQYLVVDLHERHGEKKL
eukprot:6134071-Prymnesium_polylepis.1